MADESSGLHDVRMAFDAPIPVDLPEDLRGQMHDDHDSPLGDEDAQFDAPPAPPGQDDDEPGAERECAALPLNDFGNGRRFVAHFGADALFVPGIGWHLWTGTHFEIDRHGLVVRGKAQQLGNLIAKEMPWLPMEAWQQRAVGQKPDLRERLKTLADTKDEDGKPTPEAAEQLKDVERQLKAIADIEKALGDRRKAHRNFARTAGNTSRIDAALTEAKPHISCAHDQLDAAPLDVNCLSGVLRFSVDRDLDSGAGAVAKVDLVPHDRALRMSKVIPATWDVGAKCPRFLAFLERVQPALDMRRFLQRWFGLSMLGTPIQALTFFYGAGANGKSVLVELISKILDGYAAEMRIETLTGKQQTAGGAATPDLVFLVGSRMVRASEPREGELLQDALIKSVTSGEPILVRPNYGEFFRLYPYFKLTMSGNHRPEIRSSDDGIWRRMKLVPWDVQIPEAERDADLLHKLWEERDGILQWLTDGAIEFLEGGLQEPDAVRDATQGYREDSDPIGSFVASCCLCTGEDRDRIPSRDLMQAFNWWLENRGEGKWAERTVTKKLKDKAGRWRSPRDGRGYQAVKSSGISTYTGIRFDDDFGPRFRGALRDQQGVPLAGRTAVDD